MREREGERRRCLPRLRLKLNCRRSQCSLRTVVRVRPSDILALKHVSRILGHCNNPSSPPVKCSNTGLKIRKKKCWVVAMSESSTDMLEDICRPCVRSRHSRATVCIMIMRITGFPAICGSFSSFDHILVLKTYSNFHLQITSDTEIALYTRNSSARCSKKRKRMSARKEESRTCDRTVSSPASLLIGQTYSHLIIATLNVLHK